MNIQEETKKWLTEIQEELKDVNDEIQSLELEEVILNMKVQMVSKIENKLKTPYLEKYKDKLSEIELRVDYLKEVGNDLRILEVHVASKFEQVK